MIRTVTASEIKRRAGDLGADLCGIAPAARFADAPAGFHPADVFPGCRSVAIFAARMPAAILATSSAAVYTFAMLKAADQMDALTYRVAGELERLGSPAVAIPSRDPYDYWDEARRHGRGVLSLKHAAVRAGLGRMGRNTLLVNDRLGNLLCLGAVLVGADLDADPPSDGLPCGPECRACLDACPVAALDGTTVDQSKCREYCGRSTEGGGFVYACNLCRKACPHQRGRRQ